VPANIPGDSLVLVQISDLHMSDQLECSVLTGAKGLRGHDPQLCRLLVTRIRSIAKHYRVPTSDLRWIISGDLTRVGAPAEFAVAKDFIETVPALDPLGRPLRPTLGIPRRRYVEVPGNHDHFDGWDEQSIWRSGTKNPPPAWNPQIFGANVTRTVWDNLPQPWTSAYGSIQLELFGVDSNSGLAGQTANRRAAGEIAPAEFAQLEDALRTSNRRPASRGVTVVRAIICHHAFTKKPQSGILKASPLTAGSVQQLREIAAKYRVPAILTGHTHAVNFQREDVPVARCGEKTVTLCPVYEIRCPTTLQGIADALVHGFWVHHLFRPSPKAELIWRPRLYLLAAGRLHSQPVADCEDLVLP